MLLITDEVLDLMKYSQLEDNNVNGANVSRNSSNNSHTLLGGAGGRSRTNSFMEGGGRVSSKLSLREVPIPVSPPSRGIAEAKAELAAIKPNCSIYASQELCNLPKVPLRRRNSTGTIYVETTMSCQDNSAMIHVVCVAIRAHMLTAARY